ncbi:hypothetical protein PWG15_05415 [Ensifer adhaerens]|uniref:hypothetical protein n=1 Tax=Ensifer adhaerens TaxID=106592 RepID=UPI0023AA0A07|nr:hypothetical protein [Ensifer adhaerens]WDZ77943.1 hypothetical protein PWG15_05415 [Ensifer adhaerens]
MGRLTVRSPADYSDCLTCAGGRSLARKAAIWMRNNGDSVAIFHVEELLAVVYLVPDQAGRREFCLVIRPAARVHIGKLCKLAHSTLKAMADHGVVVFCRVMPGNRTGTRMAHLTGFTPAGDEWLFEGVSDAGGEGTVRRRRGQWGCCCQERGGEEPAAAGGSE